MSAAELKTLSKIIKNGWKNLALADQSESDQLLEVIKEVLQQLEEIEGAE